MIVVADNDEATRIVLAGALERRGYAVAVVADGQLLWPMIENGGVQLLLLDLRMPGMNGWEVLRRLRDDRRRSHGSGVTPPVIVISAQSDTETRSFVERLGATAFLPKPIDLTDLDRAVRDALSTS